MKTSGTHKTLRKILTALVGIVLVAASYVLPVEAVMIYGAIDDDGSGPPGASAGAITATANATVGGERTPDKAVNGSGIVLRSGDATERTNYVHDAGIGSYGDTYNFAADIDVTDGNWFKVDLGATYVLDDAFFFNFNPDDFEGAGNEDRGVDQANIWYLDAGSDPNANNNNNGAAFDSTGWTQLGGTTNLTIAPTGDVDQTVPDVISFGGVQARFVAIDMLTNHGDGGFIGFGEIQFFGEKIVISGLIEGVTATASDQVSVARGVDHAVDWSGIILSGGDATDRDNYDNVAGADENGDLWNFLANLGGAEDNWFKVDLGQTYTLGEAHLFNFNPASGAGNESRGLGTADIYYLDAGSDPNSNDNGNDTKFDSAGWTQLGSTETFTIAPAGVSTQTVPDVIDLGRVDARFVALDMLTNQGHADFIGFGEIMFFEADMTVGTVIILR